MGLTLRAERQSAQMSKITNDRLNPDWHRMVHSCTHMATVGVKVYKIILQWCIVILTRQQLNVMTHV